MEPYKNLLQGCSVGADDLAALDIANSLSKDDGAVFNELNAKLQETNVPRPQECPADEEKRVEAVFESCVEELGLKDLSSQMRDNWFKLIENLCRYFCPYLVRT
jgi:hypothetical protein